MEPYRPKDGSPAVQAAFYRGTLEKFFSALGEGMVVPGAGAFRLSTDLRDPMKDKIPGSFLTEIREFRGAV